MHQHPNNRLAGAAGLVFVVTGLIASFGPGTPPAADAGAEEIRRFMAGGRSMVLLGGWLTILGTCAVFFFLGHLHEMVAAHDRVLGATFLMAGATAAVTGALGTLMFALVVWPEGFIEEAEPGIIRLVWSMSFMTYAVAVGATAVVLATVARAALAGEAARWLGWLAVVAAIVAAVGTVGAMGPAPSVAMFAGYLGWVVWVVAASVSMLTAKADATAPVGSLA